MEGQFILGSCVEPWVAMLDVQLHIGGESAQALSLLAAATGQLLLALVSKALLPESPLQCSSQASIVMLPCRAEVEEYLQRLSLQCQGQVNGSLFTAPAVVPRRYLDLREVWLQWRRPGVLGQLGWCSRRSGRAQGVVCSSPHGR